MCLWKLKSLSKITPRLRTLSDGDISLSSNLTGKWLESLCLCCFVPIIINSVLLEFSLSLLDFINREQARIQLLTKGVVVIMSCRRRHKAHQWGVLATLLVGCVVPPL